MGWEGAENTAPNTYCDMLMTNLTGEEIMAYSMPRATMSFG